MHQMQVWLPAPSKANAQETGANVKERSLFKHLSPEKMGDLYLKAHLNISVQARGFYKEGEGEQNKELKGRSWKVLRVQISMVHSSKTSGGPVCAILI